jgi:hypothetical protein
LGDSGFWLLRQKPSAAGTRAPPRLGVAHRSRPQKWASNCPYQLGTLKGIQMNVPDDAEVVEEELQGGDVVVLALPPSARIRFGFLPCRPHVTR